MGLTLSEVLRNELPEEEIHEYTSTTNFNRKQILKLYDIYCSLTKTRGTSAEHFVKAMKISDPEIGSIIFKVISKEEINHLTFEVFIKKLGSFLPGAPIEQKIMNTFKAFDEDDGGTISRDEIEKILYLSLNNNPYMNYEKAKVDDLLDQLIKKYGRMMPDGNYELELDDYRLMVRNAPGILDSFNLDIDEIFND